MPCLEEACLAGRASTFVCPKSYLKEDAALVAPRRPSDAPNQSSMLHFLRPDTSMSSRAIKSEKAWANLNPLTTTGSATQQVEWFCFPQGLFLRSAASQPAPHVSSFVRFTSGVRSYGLCLTFYRPVDVLEETNPFVAESAPRGAVAGGGGGTLPCSICSCSPTAGTSSVRVERWHSLSI